VKINEIFFSLQGESTLVGVPTLFIRTYGCNLKCNFCDTVYARGDLPEGKPTTGATELVEVSPVEFLEPLPYDDMTSDEIIESIKVDIAGLDKHTLFVCITGGEPLMQDHHELKELCHRLAKLTNNQTLISIETNGSYPIPWHLPHVYWVIDIKTPGSGINMCETDIADLIRSAPDRCEYKFVITGHKDYEWAVDIMRRFIPKTKIDNRDVIFSPVASEDFPTWPREIADRIVRDKIPVRFQLQLHKVIWPDKERGV